MIYVCDDFEDLHNDDAYQKSHYGIKNWWNIITQMSDTAISLEIMISPPNFSFLPKAKMAINPICVCSISKVGAKTIVEMLHNKYKMEYDSSFFEVEINNAMPRHFSIPSVMEEDVTDYFIFHIYAYIRNPNSKKIIEEFIERKASGDTLKKLKMESNFIKFCSSLEIMSQDIKSNKNGHKAAFHYKKQYNHKTYAEKVKNSSDDDEKKLEEAIEAFVNNLKDGAIKE